MEKRYLEPEEHCFVSEVVDLEDYFNTYGKLVMDNFPNFGSFHERIGALTKMSPDEMKLMKVCTKNLLPPSQPEMKDFTPPYGFKTHVMKIPDDVNNLKTFQAMKSRTLNTKEINAKMTYAGEVNLDEAIHTDTSKLEERVDLVPLAFYTLSISVYMPVTHSKYLISTKKNNMYVSQHFLCLSCGGLDSLRDRIICRNDYVPVDGDISENVTQMSNIRTKDVHKSAMFYLGNDFYIDTRFPETLDYSHPLITWGKSQGLEFGDVCRMETSTMADLKKVRLGYPYVYIHQADCEHLLVISDARLFHPFDVKDSTKYPLMKSFASLHGKFCYACYSVLARYIIVDNDRLPEDVSYMCSSCLESYNYIQGKKIGSFKVYDYVDRASLL